MIVDAGRYRRVGLLGGIYSNYLALEQALVLCERAGVDAVFALEDFGAFGPHPDRAVEVLREAGIPTIQGNYEEALAGGAEDCHCGYTDPRDNLFAQISYDYTRANTSAEHVRWMAGLPAHIRMTVAGRRVVLCHGSPRRINEFLWRSTTPAPFVAAMLRELDADLIACTHTGIHWQRPGIVNVGALGRPANDGRTEVWLTILDEEVRFVPVAYGHRRLAREMRAEGLPREFVETIESGWWTTCLEILPARERADGRF